MSDEIVKICKMMNGYEVEVCDPEQRKKNTSPKQPYSDPWKSYAFQSEAQVVKFLKKVLPSLSPEEDDMATNFQRAIEED